MFLVIYKVNILKKTNNDLNWQRKNDKKAYIKVFDLLREIMVDPRNGTGKPESLKYFASEVYSRRVSQKDRLVYTIYEASKEIEILSTKEHYKI